MARIAHQSFAQYLVRENYDRFIDFCITYHKAGIDFQSSRVTMSHLVKQRTWRGDIDTIPELIEAIKKGLEKRGYGSDEALDIAEELTAGMQP